MNLTKIYFAGVIMLSAGIALSEASIPAFLVSFGIFTVLYSIAATAARNNSRY